MHARRCGGCSVKCVDCGAPENEDTGERVHTHQCKFFEAPGAPEPAPRTGTGEPIAEPKKAPMRLMQFSGHVELTPEGEPLRVTVLISGGLASTYELGEDAELSIGDAVDLALTRAGRRLLSVDVS